MREKIIDVVGFVVVVLVPPALAIGTALGIASQINTPGHVVGGILGLTAGVFSVAWIMCMTRKGDT